MISVERFRIAQEAERRSHILKKDIDVFEKRIRSAQRVVLPYFKRIQEKLEGREKTVLDIGSGPTCLMRFFEGSKRYFLDPLMDFYKEYYPAKLPTNGVLVNATGEDLDFPDETFDVVLSYNMLDHVFHPDKIISEIKRTLKKDGYLLLGIYTHNPIMKCFRRLAEKSWIFKERPHPYSFGIHDVTNMLKDGFVIESRDRIQGEESVLSFSRRFYFLVACKNAV